MNKAFTADGFINLITGRDKSERLIIESIIRYISQKALI